MPGEQPFEQSSDRPNQIGSKSALTWSSLPEPLCRRLQCAEWLRCLRADPTRSVQGRFPRLRKEFCCVSWISLVVPTRNASPTTALTRCSSTRNDLAPIKQHASGQEEGKANQSDCRASPQASFCRHVEPRVICRRLGVFHREPSSRSFFNEGGAGVLLGQCQLGFPGIERRWRRDCCDESRQRPWSRR